MEKQNVAQDAEATAAPSQPQVATSGADVSAQELLETQINTLAAQVSQLLRAQGLQSQNLNKHRRHYPTETLTQL